MQISVFKMLSWTYASRIAMILLGLIPFVCITSSTEVNLDSLEAVQVIFRHGARVIDETYPTDPYGDESFWPKGFHQLTCIGQVQGYNLGRFLRERYDGFINETYIPKEIHALSSDIDRTVQTVYSVLSGFYPPNDPIEENNEDCGLILWKDVPVHTIPWRFDNTLRQEAPCARYKWLQNDFYTNSFVVNQLIQDNWDLLTYFANNTGITDVHHIPQLVKYFDALIIERYYNLTLPEWTEPIFGPEAGPESDSLKALARFYFSTLTYTEDMKRLRAGPLIQRVVKNFDLTLRKGVDGGEKARKMYFLSGHDHTLTSIMDSLGIYSDLTRPSFASALLIEMHRNENSSQNDVDALEIRVYFRNDTKAEEIDSLEIPECGSPCYYSKFLEIVDPFRITYDEWTQECQSIPGERSTLMKVLIWSTITLGSVVIIVTLGLLCRSVLKKNKKKEYSQLG